jgi:hypothetical protein
MNSILVEQSKAFFAENLNAESTHVSGDGQFFANENFCINHAKSLEVPLAYKVVVGKEDEAELIYGAEDVSEVAPEANASSETDTEGKAAPKGKKK